MTLEQDTNEQIVLTLLKCYTNSFCIPADEMLRGGKLTKASVGGFKLELLEQKAM